VEENLLGHLLKANDPATAREVERYLAAHPSAARELARLREALAPLEADREAFDPPGDLWVRTLARVAEHVVATEGPQTTGPSQTEELIRRAAAVAGPDTPRKPTIAPAPPPSDAAPPPTRRRNVAAVVVLSAALLALVFPAVVNVRQRAQQVACQDTMRQFHQAAVGYADVNDGHFPQVGDGQPAATAAAALRLAGYLPPDGRLVCPAAAPDQTTGLALANYAYSLGFRDERGELRGLDRRPETDYLPILADAPRRQAGEALPINHRGGQNVLFAGGNVRFCTKTTVGVDGDDIFSNARGQVAAGLNLYDTSLGRPEERP